MQVCGILQLPYFLGPSFSPFNALIALPEKLFQMLPKAEANRLPEGTPSAHPVKVAANGSGAVAVDGAKVVTPQKSKRRRNRNKRKEL
jgi:hypothetical protein